MNDTDHLSIIEILETNVRWIRKNMDYITHQVKMIENQIVRLKEIANKGEMK